MLDMHLPGVSGNEIYTMLTKRAEAHRVLICSADVQLVEVYKSMGVKAITKPAPISDPQHVVQEIICGEPCADNFDYKR
jgi:FixJ family two-component response regulator